MTRLYDNGATNSTAKDLKDTFLQIVPLAFLRSGYYYYSSGSLGGRTTDGNYWSSRPYSVTNAYRLYFYSTYLDPQGNSTRGTGRSVRCLAR